MSILAPLNDHYHYWDRFYEAWRHNDINALKGMGWSEPNFDGSNNNKTIHYLPEPWWGYSGDTVVPVSYTHLTLPTNVNV